MMRVWANIILFQLGWLACVTSAAAGKPWLGMVLVIAIIGWHIWRVPVASAEIKLIAMAIAIGLLWESFLVSQNWLAYPSGYISPVLAPYWIVMMWALFATTLNCSLNWLKGRWLLAALFGAIGGPLAFIAGSSMGAVEFNQPAQAFTALLLGWAFLTPVLSWVSMHYNGFVGSEATP